MSIALMAKMAPHGVMITGQGFGGLAAITGMDVAAALGMGQLSGGAYFFGLLKYCGDEAVESRVRQCIKINVGALAKAWEWKLTDGEFAKLCELTLAEGLSCPVCGLCNGSGVVAAKDCERCGGVGRVSRSGRERAAWLGVSETTYRRVWKGRVDDCYRTVVRWETELSEHLKRHFAKDC